MFRCLGWVVLVFEFDFVFLSFFTWLGEFGLLGVVSCNCVVSFVLFLSLFILLLLSHEHEPEQ